MANFSTGNICPKCATGECKYRDGIMCRATPCIRDLPRNESTQGFTDLLDIIYKFNGVKK